MIRSVLSILGCFFVNRGSLFFVIFGLFNEKTLNDVFSAVPSNFEVRVLYAFEIAIGAAFIIYFLSTKLSLFVEE